MVDANRWDKRCPINSPLSKLYLRLHSISGLARILNRLRTTEQVTLSLTYDMVYPVLATHRILKSSRTRNRCIICLRKGQGWIPVVTRFSSTLTNRTMVTWAFVTVPPQVVMSRLRMWWETSWRMWCVQTKMSPWISIHLTLWGSVKGSTSTAGRVSDTRVCQLNLETSLSLERT